MINGSNFNVFLFEKGPGIAIVLVFVLMFV